MVFFGLETVFGVLLHPNIRPAAGLGLFERSQMFGV